MLDNHVSVEQLMSIRNLKNDSILILCVLKCTGFFKKAHAAFDPIRRIAEGHSVLPLSPRMSVRLSVCPTACPGHNS